MTPIQLRLIAVAAAAAHTAHRALAQSPINSPGAMQPSTGTGIWHVMPMYREFGSDPTSDVKGGQDFFLLNQIAYGVTNDVSLQFDAPVIYSDFNLTGGGDGNDFGIGDMTLLAKYRIFQDDSAPTDTKRVSLIGGLQIPGNIEFEMDSSNDAWDPIIGAVFSTVHGLHGFNADVLWEFYTGDEEDQSDSLRYDASYLYRLWPETYTANTTGALYAVVELNGFYGANGDNEVYLSPGIMYETRKFTVDATVMIPVWQDVDLRAESEFIIGIGLRFSF